MKLYLDGNLSGSSDSDNLKDVLYIDVKKNISSGRVIKSIYINGKNYDDAMLDEQKSMSFKLGPEDEVRIETMGQADLLNGSIDAALAFLKEFQNGIVKATDEIRWGNGAGGFRNFSEYLKGLTTFVQVMAKISEFLNVDYGNIVFEGKNIQSYFDDLEKILASILSTQVAQDYVLLADIVEFELKPNIFVWSSILEDIKAKIKGANNRNPEN